MYLRVKVKATGHEVDIVESHFDARKHQKVSGVPLSRHRRPSIFKKPSKGAASVVSETSDTTSVGASGPSESAGMTERSES